MPALRFLSHAIMCRVYDPNFRRALPEAAVYVYDNNSRDRTCDVTRIAGAVIGFQNMIYMMPLLRRGSFPCFGTTSSTW
jgi:hypothetical protein